MGGVLSKETSKVKGHDLQLDYNSANDTAKAGALETHRVEGECSSFQGTTLRNEDRAHSVILFDAAMALPGKEKKSIEREILVQTSGLPNVEKRSPWH
ncbi:hypothetical protein DL765_011738 [Monosporascus sp. GIB2]|nr:hypothetical protein DL765_011738 [Monosporascus sp. GIB2]